MRKCWNEPGCSHSCVTLRKKASRNRFINKGIAAVSRGLRPIIGIRHHNANRGIRHSSYYTFTVLFPATSADSGIQIADIPPGSAHAHSALLYTHTKSTMWPWKGVWNNNYMSKNVKKVLCFNHLPFFFFKHSHWALHWIKRHSNWTSAHLLLKSFWNQ